jgi:hypothetical protein
VNAACLCRTRSEGKKTHLNAGKRARHVINYHLKMTTLVFLCLFESKIFKGKSLPIWQSWV